VKNAFKLTASLIFVFAFCGCGRDEKSAATVNTIQCASNLRTIRAIKANWVRQGADTNATPTWDDLAQFLRHGAPTCPDGGTYTLGKAGEAPTCSIAAHNQYFHDHANDEQ
jgi:hypothetical protein